MTIGVHVSFRIMVFSRYMPKSGIAGSCKLVQPLWRTVWRFLKKLKIELPYDSAVPILSIYPEKTIIRKDTCTKLALILGPCAEWLIPSPSTSLYLDQFFHYIFPHNTFYIKCKLYIFYIQYNRCNYTFILNISPMRFGISAVVDW